MNFTHKSLLIPLPLGVTLIIETTADQPTFNIQTGGIVTGETASAAYQADHHLGAPSAEVRFDL